MTPAESTWLLALCIRAAFRDAKKRAPTLEEAVPLAAQLIREWEGLPPSIQATAVRIERLVREVRS